MRLAAVVTLLAGCRIGFEDTYLIEKPEPALSDRALVVRYFLDEADAGQAPQLAHDAAPDPYDLPMRYDTATDPLWAARDTGRGLTFPAIELQGGACRPVEGKLQLALGGTTSATIEVVVDLTAGSASGSRLFHIGRDQTWGLSLGYVSVADPMRDHPIPHLVFGFNERADFGHGRWAVDLSTRGRVVLTLVLDTAQPDPAARVRLAVDGVFATTDVTLAAPPGQDEALSLRPDQHACLANRFIGARTPVGMISYAAVYADALDEAELVANVARLAAWDDP